MLTDTTAPQSQSDIQLQSDRLKVGYQNTLEFVWFSICVRLLFLSTFHLSNCTPKITLESIEHFSQMSSKSFLIISSYAVSKLVCF